MCDVESRIDVCIYYRRLPIADLVEGDDAVRLPVHDAARRAEGVDALAGHPAQLLIEGLDLLSS